MRPLARLTAAMARRIDTFVFDLDDTVLDHGELTEAAFSALFRLRETGLALVACTGRPAAWAEIVCRQWPVDAAIAENGAVAWVREAHRVTLRDPVAPPERASRRARLAEVTAVLLGAVPELALADDNAGRISDVTFDIGEHRKVERIQVLDARARATQLGVRTFASSVHLHLTLDGHDKSSGFVALSASRGRDPAEALHRAAFVGDSANDAPAFAAFGLTFGVRNAVRHLPQLTVPPNYLADHSMGGGFAQIARRLAELRARSG